MSEERPAPPVPQIDPFGSSPTAEPIRPGDIALKEGEGMVRLLVAKPIMVTLDPGDPATSVVGGNRVQLNAGEYDVPESLANHWYVKASGAVVLNRNSPAASDRAAVAAPKSTPEAGEEVKPQPAPSSVARPRAR